MSSLLEVRSLASGYGDVQVLWDISLDVDAGEMACVVGSNGAGKTTLLRTLSGTVRRIAGHVFFNGKDISDEPPHRVLGGGLAHVPEGRRLFKGLSVRDNLLLGAYLRAEAKADVERDLEWVFSLFPILAERRRQDATTLSGGEQQMCAIGRGLMARPKLLMIDELSLGLAPRAVENLTETLREVNRTGLAILLVEQDVMTAFDIAGRGVVVETGRTTLSGSTSELAEHPRVREAYLGI